MRRSLLLVFAGVGLLAVTAISAALVSDLVRSEAAFVLEDPVEALPVIPFGAATGAGEADLDQIPGAMLSPVLVPAPPPLLPGEPTAQPAGGGSTSTPGTTITSAPGTATPPGPTPNTKAVGVAAAPGSWMTSIVDLTEAQANEPTLVTVYRFFDLCADALSTACPDGLGATVLFAGSDTPPPPLAVEIMPDPPQAVRSSVRCDLPWPSGTTIPLLILSNRPLDLYHARLSLAGGGEVASAVNLRTTAAESSWHASRVAAGKPVGTSLHDAVHTCVTIDIDGPSVPAGIQRTDRFSVTVTGFAGQSTATRTRTFDGAYTAGRAPVRIYPLDGYRAMMVVPQRANDAVGATLNPAWATTGLPGAGTCPTSGSAYSQSLTQRNPAQGATAYSTADMQAADYPWDRDYTHYTVWDLYLESGHDYTVCVHWALDDLQERFTVRTPNLWSFNLNGRRLGYGSKVDAGSLTLHVPGIAHCWVANPGQGSAGGRDPFPEVTLSDPHGWATWAVPDPGLCLSQGSRYPDPVEVWSGLSKLGDNTVYGVARIPIPVLMKDCRVDQAAAVITLADGCAGPTLEWRSQKVLCGGPIGLGDCKGDLIYNLTTWVWMSGDSRWDRTDPKDWIISQTVVMAEPEETLPLDELEPKP